MKRKQSAAGLGFSSSNETAKDASSASFKKQLRTMEVSNAYREFEQLYPDLKQRMSFVEFRTLYFKKSKKTLQKIIEKIQAPQQEKIEFKPRIRRVTKEGKIIE